MKVRVRIAVAVDANGHWVGYGHDNGKSWDDCMDCMLDGLRPGEARYWVYADLDVSEIKEVEGVSQQVEEPTDKEESTN